MSIYSNCMMSQVNFCLATEITNSPLPNTISSHIITAKHFKSFKSSSEATKSRRNQYPVRYTQLPASMAISRINYREINSDCWTRGEYGDKCTNSACCSYEQQDIRERLWVEQEQFTNYYPHLHLR